MTDSFVWRTEDSLTQFPSNFDGVYASRQSASRAQQSGAFHLLGAAQVKLAASLASPVPL